MILPFDIITQEILEFMWSLLKMENRVKVSPMVQLDSLKERRKSGQAKKDLLFKFWMSKKNKLLMLTTKDI
jgi:hypothetical protein